MKTIQEMARKVGYPIQHEEWRKATEEFAALVRADERESIAKWYESEGHMMFPVAIPDAIRSTHD